MIDYPALEALFAVIEQGGFEKAAKVLNVSQSAVSQRIRQLEFRLGQPVLLRSTPPRLTELGQRLSNHLQQVKQLEQGLLDHDQTEQLNIRLAVNADSLDTWLAPALAQCELSARMNFDFIVEDQRVGLQRMKNGEVMACICESEQAVNGGKVQKLGVMRYLALASPEFIQRFGYDHSDNNPNLKSTAKATPKRGLKWLQQAPCLLFSGDDQLQHQVLDKLKLAEPERVQRVPSSGGFVTMARAGLGFGMMPEIQVREYLDDGSLVKVAPRAFIDIPLYWHYWQSESRYMAQLREAVVSYAQAYLR